MTDTVLDILCPQHICYDECGAISHIGLGLRSVFPNVIGVQLFDVISISRPVGVGDVASLLAQAGRTLAIDFAATTDCVCVGLWHLNNQAVFLAYHLGLHCKMRLNSTD